MDFWTSLNMCRESITTALGIHFIIPFLCDRSISDFRKGNFKSDPVCVISVIFRVAAGSFIEVASSTLHWLEINISSHSSSTERMCLWPWFFIWSIQTGGEKTLALLH